MSLVHEDRVKDFADIENIDALKTRFKAGFGKHWADMKILEDNGLDVFGVVKYNNLFKMLEKKRFDYFPRGINEAWIEIAAKGQEYPSLVVEPNIAIYYPYPVFFFVHKSEEGLATRIEQGLKMALEDGTFKELFLKYHADLFKQADLENRRLFVIKNTNLPADTPLPDTSWWLPEQHTVGSDQEAH